VRATTDRVTRTAAAATLPDIPAGALGAVVVDPHVAERDQVRRGAREGPQPRPAGPPAEVEVTHDHTSVARRPEAPRCRRAGPEPLRSRGRPAGATRSAR